MTKRRKLNPRKVLIASVGIATVDYIAACSGNVAESPPMSDSGAGGSSSGNGGSTVANLVAPPAGGGGTVVANLVAPAAGGYPGAGGFTVANLIAPPGGSPGAGGYSVANLVAPPLTGGFGGVVVDAGRADATDVDAAATDASRNVDGGEPDVNVDSD